jgi:hypothetical protein
MIKFAVVQQYTAHLHLRSTRILTRDSYVKAHLHDGPLGVLYLETRTIFLNANTCFFFDKDSTDVLYQTNLQPWQMLTGATSNS